MRRSHYIFSAILLIFAFALAIANLFAHSSNFHMFSALFLLFTAIVRQAINRCPNCNKPISPRLFGPDGGYCRHCGTKLEYDD